MKAKNLIILDKEDTKKFYKQTNKLARSFIRSTFKYCLLGKFKISKRYFEKAKSLLKNKRMDNYPQFENKGKSKKVAVYTALYGDCDQIKNINCKSDYCDFYIFTDQEIPANSGWTKKEIQFPEEINNNVLKNRYLKMHPHLLFSDYEYSIYLDAVFIIELDIFRLLARMGNKKMGLFKHHAGVSCLYDEAERLKRIGKVDFDETDKMMNRYKKEE